MEPTSQRSIERRGALQAIGAAVVVALDAPGGFGKTTLAQQLAAADDATVVRIAVAPHQPSVAFAADLQRELDALGFGSGSMAGADNLTVLAAALAQRLESEAAPLLILVDDAHRATPEVVAGVVTLATTIRAPHRLVVAGRGVDASIAERASLRVGVDTLRFSADEIGRLAHRRSIGLDADGAGALLGLVDGWPAAVDLALAAWGGRAARTMHTRPLREELLTSLVDELLAGLDAPVAAVVMALASLPLLSAEVAESIGGPGAWRALQSSGLPMTSLAPAGGRWWQVADPIREVLAARAPLSESVGRAAAEAYSASGRVQEGLRLLARAGFIEDLAELLSSLDGDRLSGLHPAEFAAFTAVLGDSVLRRHPAVVLQQARLLAVVGNVAGFREALDRADAFATAARDDLVARAVAAERVRLLARGEDPSEALRLGSEVLGSAGERELRTRARCLAGMGLAEAATGRPGALTRAAAHLTEAAALANVMGERGLEAGALHWLGYWVHYADGRLDAAVQAQRSAVLLLDPADRRRGLYQTFFAEMLAAAGRDTEAMTVLDEAAQIGRQSGDPLTLAYAAWVRGECASHRGDEAELRRQLAEIERNTGSWYEHETGTELEAAIVEMWRRLDRPDEALAHLARLDQRTADGANSAAIARAAHVARFGDPQRAEHLLWELLCSSSTRRVALPRIEALRAMAAARAGDLGLAVSSMDRARRLEAEAGMAGMLDVVEREAVRVARRTSSAQDTGDAIDTPVTPCPTAEVRLLGRFEVIVDGTHVRLPPGQASELVQRLAVAGRAIAVEELLDTLWPEADLPTARRRLRNLLNRLRESGGDLVVRRGASLVLVQGARVDAHNLIADIDAARRNADLSALEHAVDRAGGGLLPDERYADWTVPLRERCTAAVLGALRTLAGAARADADHQRALLLLLRALDLQPFDEALYSEAVGAALGAGQETVAASLRDRCRRVLAELAIETTLHPG